MNFSYGSVVSDNRSLINFLTEIFLYKNSLNEELATEHYLSANH